MVGGVLCGCREHRHAGLLSPEERAPQRLAPRPPCPRRRHCGGSSSATLPAAAASGSQSHCAVRRLWAWGISQPLPASALCSRPSFSSGCLQSGVQGWGGGPHPGRRNQPEPAASSWPGDGRAQCPPPTPCPRRTWCQAQLPGCYSKCLLLVALWRGSGVLALKYIGLCEKTRCLPLCRLCLSLRRSPCLERDLTVLIPRESPSLAPHCPVEARERPQGLLGPGTGQALPPGHSPPLAPSPPGAQMGMYQPLSSV